ncbi:enkurin isoform X1 [Lethenteron reissneri]|uniref:enkurin isoform X1 n=1 Tax=Lethenteron reissneri TaxID=7753 RepID=UPI002AB7D344|nr:enkurin isoform X1 [Lethenteron reissneri]
MMAMMNRQEESVYNLIPREEVTPEKPPRYISRFRESIRLETNERKKGQRTMGPAKVEVPSPQEYLHKHSRDAALPEKGGVTPVAEKPFHYPDEGRRRPRVPGHDERPPMGLHSRKDFVNTNAVDVITAVPRRPQPTLVDTKRGDRQPLDPSGLVPKFVRKKEYGQVPEYIVKRNEEMRQAQEEYDAYVRERLRRGALNQMSEQERSSILQGLKQNWDELHRQYQGLSVVTDTAPKKHRKERLETEMKQLEKDIELIDRHKIIYVTNK